MAPTVGLRALVWVSLCSSLIPGNAQQLITSCPCDGSSSQQWQYPSPGTIGPVTQGSSCWGIIADGCNIYDGWCVELVSGPSCSAPLLTTWNVSVGLNDTMIFSAATDEPAGTIGLCLDWNLRKNLTELWECGAVGKTNQEWFASPNNGIGEFQLGGCLCVDTNSRSQSPSASVAPSPSRPPVTQQRISTCTCDGSPDQAWSFPGVQETGPVFHVASERCWALVKDNCGSRFCIDLDSKFACATPSLLQWNVTAGDNGTVLFRVAGNAPAEVMGWCADYFRPNKQLELYACTTGNQQQEWYAEDETIVDRGAGLCLCPDTRNSPSTTNSLSPSPTPSTSHAPLPQQRITTCDCDGSASQAWDYAPAEGSIGPVVNRLTSQCWALVTDDCAVARDDDGGYTACVELQDPATCAALGSPDFNVSRGTAAGTVVFTVVGNAPADAIGLCVDYNADIGQLELYQCYNYENQQQEWIENLTTGALVEVNNKKCLCPDTRNSQSNTASTSYSSSQAPSVGASPSRSPSATPSKSRVPPPPPNASNSGSSNVGLGVGLGLGIPLGLLALAAAALFGYSSYSGTPVMQLVGKATGGLLGGGGTPASAKLLGGSSSTRTAASASRVTQLGQAASAETAVPDTTSLLRGAAAPGSGRYGGL